jgi:SAM-dependent methyltransferase
VISASTTWGVGAYPLMAERLVPAAEVAVSAVDVSGDDRVVDLACGTGNAALLAAHRGAAVIGVDFEQALLDVASRRARELGVEVRWRCADLSQPGAETEPASVVISIFGVMYMADHQAAAAALASWCAPSGRVALTAWTPGSTMPALGAVFAPFLPPLPPDAQPPSRWGDANALRSLLGEHGLALNHSEIRRLRLSFGDQRQAADFLVHAAGHVLQERQRLEGDGRWPDLLAAVQAFVADRDVGTDGEATLELEYLFATARRLT